MLTPVTFYGYPGQLWQSAYQTLTWLSGQLNGGAAPALQQASAASVSFQTLRNVLANMQAWQAGQALNSEVAALSAVQALPITVDPTTSTYFTARISAYSAAASGVSALPQAVNVTNIPALLTAGTPAVADPLYLEWCMSFTGEAAPGSLTGPELPVLAAAQYTAWCTVAAAVATYQGVNLTQEYDTAARLARCAGVVSNKLASLVSGPFAVSANPTLLWNNCAALPALLLDSALLNATPNLVQNQQCGLIRYALNNMLITLAQFLLALRQPVLSQITQAQVRAKDTLMDIAARNLGNFEQWSAIATLNGLTPPYPGADNTSLVGKQLLLPGSTGTVVSGASAPTYAANVLGTDYDFGPINGAQPVWTGDFRLITGLLNFARALGRRLQTPRGSLIYHVDYGSRIPPEVGAIQAQDEAQRISQFGVSALRSDPRTGTVQSATATILPGSQVSFQASVQPVGPGTQPVFLNETISPLP